MNLTTQQELALYAKWKAEHPDVMRGNTSHEWFVRNYVETRLMPALASDTKRLEKEVIKELTAPEQVEQMGGAGAVIEPVSPHGEGTWEDRFDAIPNLKTQEESWICDAGCGVDRKKIKAFLATELSHQAKGIVEMLEGMYVEEADQLSEGSFYKSTAILGAINKIRNNYIND